MIILVVTAIGSTDRFRGAVDGLEIVKSSRWPLLDGARALLSADADPADILVMRRSIDGPDCLRSPLWAAAKLTVRENPSVRFALWQPFAALDRGPAQKNSPAGTPCAGNGL